MYPNNHDKFARLKAIASGQQPETATTAQDIKFWSFERNGDIMGTIMGFEQLEHPQFGEQHTVIVRLADTNELVSAFLTGWLQEGMRRQKANVGDLVLIQFLGKQAGERFNRFNLEIEKPNTAF
jgi:hypothetical protein